MQIFLKKLGRNFWYYRIGQIISFFGDQLGFIAISFYILNYAKSAAGISRVVVPASVLGLIVSFLFGPFGDSLSRKKSIISGNLMAGFVWLMILLFFLLDILNMKSLATFYVLSSIGLAFATIGATGFLPEIIAKEQLSLGYKVITASSALAKICGGACAGVVVGFLGIKSAFLLNALSFVVIATLTVKIKPKFGSIKPQFNVSKINEIFNSLKHDLYVGMRYVYCSEEFFPLTISLFFSQLIIVPLQIALPFFVKNCLHETSLFFGLFISAQGVGAVLASFILKYFSNKLRKDVIILMSFLFVGCGILLLGLTVNKIYLLLCLVLIGVGSAIANIIINVSLLRLVPKYVRSRFFTILLFVEGCAIPLSLLFSGYLIDRFGVINIFFMMGVGLSFFVLVAAYLKVFNVLLLDEELV
jgi:MFS family permease